jgi:hypothetical protein
MDAKVKETVEFRKLELEIMDRRESIRIQNEGAPLEGSIELAAGKCIDVPTFFEKGDKGIARVVIPKRFMIIPKSP